MHTTEATGRKGNCGIEPFELHGQKFSRDFYRQHR